MNLASEREDGNCESWPFGEVMRSSWLKSLAFERMKDGEGGKGCIHVGGTEDKEKKYQSMLCTYTPDLQISGLSQPDRGVE